MNYPELELKLCDIVERRLEEGFFLKRYHATIDCYGAMCLVGAIGVEQEPPMTSYGTSNISGLREAAKRVLGFEDTFSLEAGFEGFEFYDGLDKRMYAIGARIRRDYYEFTNE